MDDLSGGHDGFYREIAVAEVPDHPFGHHRRRPVPGCHSFQGTVWLIDDIVQGGHIDTGNLGGGLEEFLLAPALLPGLPVELDDLHADLLPLPKDEEVHKGGQGLRIVGAGTARHHNGGQAVPLLTAQGQAGQIQHVEHVGVGHLIAQGKADEVEIRDGVPAFQTIEQDTLPAHFLLHVPPGGEHPLTPYPFHLIHHTVENAHAQIGHTDLIGVRKAERIAHIHGAPVLHHRVVFPAGIAGGLLDPGKDMFQRSIHVMPNPLCLNLCPAPVPWRQPSEATAGGSGCRANMQKMQNIIILWSSRNYKR